MDQKLVKNAVMVTVLFVWSLYMVTYLFRGVAPEPALWGIPGGVWLILNPPPIKLRKPGQTDTANTEE